MTNPSRLRCSPSFPHATRFARTPHGALAYFDAGQASYGEPLVFVHGLGGDFTHFEHLARDLARDHRVIGVDMPGCGGSCKPSRRHTIRGYAEALLALLDHLGLPRATLVGHSAGAQVCAAAAALAPARAARLVLINASGLRGYPAPMRWAARALFREVLLEPVLLRSADWILANVFARDNAHTRKFHREATGRPRYPLLPEMSKVFHDLVPDLMTPTVVRSADRLAMPTLVVWGRQDRLVPLATVERATRALPDARLVVIDRCGHMPIIEAPEETLAAIRSFLGAQARDCVAA